MPFVCVSVCVICLAAHQLHHHTIQTPVDICLQPEADVRAFIFSQTMSGIISPSRRALHHYWRGNYWSGPRPVNYNLLVKLFPPVLKKRPKSERFDGVRLRRSSVNCGAVYVADGCCVLRKTFLFFLPLRRFNRWMQIKQQTDGHHSSRCCCRRVNIRSWKPRFQVKSTTLKLENTQASSLNFFSPFYFFDVLPEAYPTKEK